MIDTVELSALMRQGTGMDEATANKIAQAILRANEMSPPVSRDHLDEQLKATREYLDGQLAATRQHLDDQLKVTREYLDGRLSVAQEHVEKRLAQVETNFQKSLGRMTWGFWTSALATISLTLGGVYFLLTHVKP